MRLAQYLESVGRGKAAHLARALGVHAVTVSDWRKDMKQVPKERCPFIEQATQGEVACEDLRDDVVWHRVPDADWPWHPLGRPLIDVTRRTARAAQAQQQEARDAA